MKKTTYILIGTVALVLLTAFFGPAIFFKKRHLVQTLDDTSFAAPVTPGSFSSLSVEFSKWPVFTASPVVEISESDSIAAPKVTLTNTLKDNAVISLADGQLKITVDLHSAAPGDTPGFNVQIDNSSTPIARIEVPEGTLKTIRSEYVDFRLRAFTGPVSAYCRDLYLSDGSTIPSMTATIAGDSGLTVTTDPTSSIDTLTTAPQGRCDINLFNASVKTVINRPATKDATTITLSSAAEIKP